MATASQGGEKKTRNFYLVGWNFKNQKRVLLSKEVPFRGGFDWLEKVAAAMQAGGRQARTHAVSQAARKTGSQAARQTGGH